MEVVKAVIELLSVDPKDLKRMDKKIKRINKKSSEIFIAEELGSETIRS